MDHTRKRPPQNIQHEMPDHPEPTVIQMISTEHLDSLSDSFNQTLGEVLGYIPNHIDHHKPMSQFQISDTWILQVISYFGQKCRVDLLEDGPGILKLSIEQILCTASAKMNRRDQKSAA